MEVQKNMEKAKVICATQMYPATAFMFGSNIFVHYVTSSTGVRVCFYTFFHG